MTYNEFGGTLNLTQLTFTLGRMSLDKSLHMRVKTLLATLFSVLTIHMWSDLSSDMHVYNVSKNVAVLLNGIVHTRTHVRRQIARRFERFVAQCSY